MGRNPPFSTQSKSRENSQGKGPKFQPLVLDLGRTAQGILGSYSRSMGSHSPRQRLLGADPDFDQLGATHRRLLYVLYHRVLDAATIIPLAKYDYDRAHKVKSIV
jgi:hypothetical protein